jgi:hypothetical protein
MNTFCRLGSVVVLVLALGVAGAVWGFDLNDVALFDPAVAGLQGWGSPRGLDLSAPAGALQLRVTAADSSITRVGLQVDPGMGEWLNLRYRASGFTAERTSGELFFASAGAGFAELQYAHLPALQTDGEWHELWVNLPGACRRGADSWWQAGTITALRLDLVNEAPGAIEVGALRLTAQRAPEVLSAGGRLLRRWKEPHNLALTERDGVLVLDVRDKDCRIFSAEVPLDPQACRYLALRYRGTGCGDGATTGQIFYANRRHGIDAAYQIPLPSLTRDGAWHDLVVDTWEVLGRAGADWLNGGPVTELRLDLVDQAPGQIELAHVFVTPRLRVTSTDELALPPGRQWLLPASAFMGPGGKPQPCTLTLPAGDYGVWQRCLAGSGEQAWQAAARSTGGRLTVPPAVGALADAVLVGEGGTAPRDAPVAVLQPASSTIRPLPVARKAMLKPYWQGEMMVCPQGGSKDPVTGFSRSGFRRVFSVPADLTDAWLQISVDDFFRLYLDGELIAENFAADSWMTPTVIELTTRLKRGGEHVLAVEAHNRSSATGSLVDLVLNRPDHSCVRLVSDAEWRSSAGLPEGWTRPGFDDAAWVAPSLLPGPPRAPWVVEIPYVNKAWEPPTRCLELQVPATVTAGEVLPFACRLQSAVPVAVGEVLVATLSEASSGRVVLQREFPLAAANLSAVSADTVQVQGLELPLSRWWPALQARLTVGLYGRALPDAGGASADVVLRGAAPTPNLTSAVQTRDGTPRLLINGQPTFTMVGNGEGRERAGTLEAFRAGGFNVAAVWVDPMGSRQWWTGPEQYDFASVDEVLVETLDRFPEALLLPIVWAAPPPWWAALYPAEIARFSDGTSWPYYRSTASFSSRQWRADATQAMTAFVHHLEGSPLAGRVLGYWVIGGVSAEWQGWGCHNSAADRRAMDYSAPEQDAFRAYLTEHYPARADLATAGVPSLDERLGRELGVFRDPALAAAAIAYARFCSESVTTCMLTCVGAAKRAVGGRKIVGTYYGYSLEYANMDWCLQMSGHNAVRQALNSPDIDFFSAPHSYAVRRLGGDMGWMWAAHSLNLAGKLFWPDDDSRTYLSGPCDYTPAINPAQTRETLRRNFGKQLCHLNPVGFLQIESGRELGSAAIARDARLTRRAGEFALEKRVRRRAEIAVVIDEDSIPFFAYDQGHLSGGRLEPALPWNGERFFYDRQVNNLAADLLSTQRERIATIGAPVDWILASDLVRQPLEYKLYIMLSTVQFDDALLQAVQRQIQGREVTVLWCYAPGFIRNGTAEVGHMAALTGLRLQRVAAAPAVITLTSPALPLLADLTALSFGAPYAMDPRFAVDDPQAETLGVYRDGGGVGLASKVVDRCRSVYCGATVLPPGLLRGLARQAGVHLYATRDDVLDANDAFVLLHTATAGDKTLTLPRPGDVVDVYTGTVVAQGVQQFTLHEAAETTRLFYVGTALEFRRYMDYDRVSSAGPQ